VTAGQWEQYEAPAAKAMEQFWAPLRGHTDEPDEIDFALANAILNVVGPLIAEDTRDRLVAAAGVAAEREQGSGQSVGGTDPFASLADTLAFSSNDWGSAADFAWLYGIVLGWDSDDPTEESAMPSLAEKHEWSDQRVARLRALHRDFKTAAAAYRCDASEAAS
jgi:hypothetical protein